MEISFYLTSALERENVCTRCGGYKVTFQILGHVSAAVKLILESMVFRLNSAEYLLFKEIGGKDKHQTNFLDSLLLKRLEAERLFWLSLKKIQTTSRRTHSTFHLDQQSPFIDLLFKIIIFFGISGFY